MDLDAEGLVKLWIAVNDTLEVQNSKCNIIYFLHLDNLSLSGFSDMDSFSSLFPPCYYSYFVFLCIR